MSDYAYSKRYDQGADMWAFGVMIYLMLFGRYPFEGSKASAIAVSSQLRLTISLFVADVLCILFQPV